MASTNAPTTKIVTLEAMSSKTPLTYRDSGVDIDQGNALVDLIKPMVKKTQRPEVMGGLGGFGGLFRLGDRYRDPVLVSGTDGVGTKLLLAQQHQHLHTIGIDLVAMCVNDILVSGAEPLFFLDYFACGKLETEQASQVIAGIADGCQMAGCALIGGETAEMPDMYPAGKFDLAGFGVGVIERDQMITGDQIKAGDRLIGIASTGPHSNGYSLIRRVIERDPQALHQPMGGHTLIEALLTPTQIYVRSILDLLAKHSSSITGLAHITGGGLTENITRIVPESLAITIDETTWSMPEVFSWLMETGNIPIDEMRRTFNMGVGFVVIARGDDLEPITQCLNEHHGLSAWVMGEVVACKSNERVQYQNG